MVSALSGNDPLRVLRCGLPRLSEGIAGAASTFEILNENPVFDQVKDVAMCRVLGAFGERGVFRGCEFAFEPVEQAVDRQPLTVVELHIFDAIPEARFGENRAQGFLRSIKCSRAPTIDCRVSKLSFSALSSFSRRATICCRQRCISLRA